MMVRSWSVKSVFSAWAKVPLIPRSQQERRLCRYAPLPAALPVGSIMIPCGVRTTRINDRFGKICRHPTQVRCGICLTLLPVLFVTCHSLKYVTLPIPNRLRRACVSSLQEPRHGQGRRSILQISSSSSYPFYFYRRIHHLLLRRQAQ